MISAPNAILQALSTDYRRVLSRWRALIYLRRASNEYASEERRWLNVPGTYQDLDSLLRRMQSSGQIESIDHAPGCYEAITPYAQTLPVREDELLLEINPYAVITHYTALVFHGFTLNRPNIITAWAGERGWVIPIGTTEEEWEGVDFPHIHRPRRILNQDVRWFNRFPNFSFGVVTDYSGPIQVRVTDPERTLIDALQWPTYAGGIGNVVNAWELARNFVDIQTIINYTEQYEINLLRQRVGYIAEMVGFRHSSFDQWAEHSTRGGSSRLVGARPFSSEIDSRWNLSINAPVKALLT